MQKVKIGLIKANPNNPRTIKDDAFRKLVASIRELPEMANVRPIVVNQDMVVLGGNMRLKAMKEAGWTEVPIVQVDWPEEKQRQFIIKDNVSGGEWDWEMLANEWEASDLLDRAWSSQRTSQHHKNQNRKRTITSCHRASSPI